MPCGRAVSNKALSEDAVRCWELSTQFELKLGCRDETMGFAEDVVLGEKGGRSFGSLLREFRRRGSRVKPHVFVVQGFRLTLKTRIDPRNAAPFVEALAPFHRVSLLITSRVPLYTIFKKLTCWSIRSLGCRSSQM